MRFPNYRRAATYRATIPALSGGVNAADAPHAVKDHQMTDAENLWWSDGALRTRRGLQYEADALFSVRTLTTNADFLSPESLVVGDRQGRLLIGAGRVGMAQNRIQSVLVQEDGRLTGFSNDVSYGFPIRHLLHVCDEKDAQSLGMVLTDSAEVPLLKLNVDGTVEAKAPYIPTILLQVTGDENASAAEPAGYAFESRNMLTEAFAMECATGEGMTYYHLPTSVRGAEATLTVTGTDVQGTVTHELYAGNEGPGASHVFTEETAKRDGLRLRYNRDEGTFCFVNTGNTAVSTDTMPYTALKVTFCPTAELTERRSTITGMRFGTWFGGDRTGLSGGTRFFVAGNPAYPHLLYYSGLSDATYFPENNYVYVGHPASAITALRQQGNMLVIFKEHEVFAATYSSTTVSADAVLQSAVIDVETAQAAFPLTPISSTVGCDCPDSIALCGNRLIWTNSDRKVYTLHAANSKSERNLRELSTPIEPFLKTISRAAYRTAKAVDFNGYYGLFIGADGFLFHYDEQSFYNYSSYDAGDKPGKILAWHRFRLPEDFAYDYVVSGGDSPLFIGCIGSRAVSFSLSGAQDVYYPDTVADLNPSWRCIKPIESYFCSKTFDFGAPDRKKQIKRLTLDAETAGSDTCLAVSYVTERGQERGSTAVRGDELPFSFHPNGKRVRRFGIRCDVTGEAAINGMCIRYEIQG